MEPRLQAKLLRAIQEREIDRVGGSKPVPVDIRLIATSNRDLERAVADGTFREDSVPPERADPAAAAAARAAAGHRGPGAAFAAKLARLNGLPDAAAESPRRWTVCARLPWRGNVRELENCLHRAVMLARGDDDRGRRHPSQAPARLPPAAAVAGHRRRLVGRTVAEVERLLIFDTLRPYPGQPHARRHHPRHLDPHAAQQAARVRRRPARPDLA